MDRDSLLREWKIDEEAAFSGWDFSYLNGRWENEKLPWDYEAIVKQYLVPDQILFDMDTGGGEFLLSLGHPYKNTVVSEAWGPNILLCQKKLEPLGIAVKKCDPEKEPLPLSDESVDIITNRHGSFMTDELFRVLRHGGYFVTQQVGGRNNNKLSNTLIKNFQPKYPEMEYSIISDKLKKSGFEIIESSEFFPKLRFFDTGAIAYFAKVIEWEFPDFHVESSVDALMKIEAEIKETGYYESLEQRMYFVARKP